MPSGRTHDRITLWSLPLVAGFTFEQTQSGELTLLLASGFLLGGLMFGPDLDIYSRQYRRWGYLRWIWLPYRKQIRHRSILSHGPLIGTTLRLLYLAGWLVITGLSIIVGVSIAYQLLGQIPNWMELATLLLSSIADLLGQWVQTYPYECLLFYLGLELGAMSHYLSDWSVTAYKRVRLYGLRSLWSPGRREKSRSRWSDRPASEAPMSAEVTQLSLPLDPVEDVPLPPEPRRPARREPQLPPLPPPSLPPFDRRNGE